MLTALRTKLTVADLKDILEKHSLPKTGNKAELVKRIVEHKAYPAEMAPEGEAVHEEEELVCLRPVRLVVPRVGGWRAECGSIGRAPVG